MLATSVRGAPGDFRALNQQVRAAGLLRRRPWAYGIRIAGTLGALVAGVVALVVLGNSRLALALAAVLAVVFVQVVFVGHDAGHQQIFRSPRANWILGLIVGDLLTGLSIGWWVPKHNAHHTHPNQVDRDPDIAAGVLAFTPEIAGRRHGIGRFVARRQAWLFFPMLLLEGVAMHVSSIEAVARRRDKRAVVEALALTAHTAGYLFLAFGLLSPLRALAFIAIHQAIFGLYLGCSFAPNHKGMPILAHDDPHGFVHRQVVTSRNIRGGWLTAFALGGLNYQIEHHLFPSMPRANLARAQRIVRTFCVDQGLAYREDSLIGSYRQTLRHLSQVGNGAVAIQPAG